MLVSFPPIELVAMPACPAYRLPYSPTRRCSLLAFVLAVTALTSVSSLFGQQLSPQEPTLHANAAVLRRLNDDFTKQVVPAIERYCLQCHRGADAEAQLDLSDDRTLAAVRQRHQVWNEIARRLGAHEMPPADASQQPTDHEREQIVRWVAEFRRAEAERTAQDPGPNLSHRLSAAEYNYTIRDLTGVDIGPARELPVDPANEAG
ncbi:MAG: DUF1587 domain-containing protein, partial [Planctomycetales bacterium]|nr:DUF1587 domain-containing protein [Planctomycetales bacterium]